MGGRELGRCGDAEPVGIFQKCVGIIIIICLITLPPIRFPLTQHDNSPPSPRALGSVCLRFCIIAPPPCRTSNQRSRQDEQRRLAMEMDEEDEYEWGIMPFIIGDGSNTTSGSSTSSTSPSINRYSVLWGLALTGFSLTLLIALPYLACLLARPPSKIRRFYFAAALLPLVFALSALATCLAPGSDEYWGLLQHVCEAWALHSLNQVGSGCGWMGGRMPWRRRAGKLSPFSPQKKKNKDEDKDG